MRGVRGFWVVPAAALLLAGCSDEGPMTPAPGAGSGATAQTLSCEADLGSGDLSCVSVGGSTGSALGAIIGGQGIFVELASNNVGYDSGTEVFSADVTVKNLSDQVLGSSDGTTPEPTGIRLFFAADPVTTGGTGSVTVRNADGEADFDKTGQPYFEYLQALAPGRTSLPRNWAWDVPSTVTSFSFMVGVSAELQDESAIEPGLDLVAQSISADSLHTCALDLTGQAYCWGRGSYGRLGNNSNADQSLPVAVEQGTLRFVALGTGLTHSCALADTGDAYCWGNAGVGRLGSGDTDNQFTPVAVQGGHKFVQLAVGRRNACARTAEGDAYCWGTNSNGEIGDGTKEHRDAPTPVSGGHKFTWLGAGNYHMCGVVEGGDAYCWGSSTNSKTGGPARGAVEEPELVPGGHHFAKVTGMYHMSCGITAEGETWCWGSNGNGKLGDGTEDLSEVPVQVAGGHRFLEVSGGSQHVCALDVSGKAWCWGSQARGKLGNGETASGKILEPVEVLGGHTFVTIASGNSHVCGSTGSGEIYCWGNDEITKADTDTNAPALFGVLGAGTDSHSGVPVPVMNLNGIALSAPASSCGTSASAELCFPRRPLAENVMFGWSASFSSAFGLL